MIITTNKYSRGVTKNSSWIAPGSLAQTLPLCGIKLTAQQARQLRKHGATRI